MCLALNHRPCLKSSPDATIHGDVLRRVRITTASIKAPFPGDHARQGHRYAASADGPPLTFTRACTTLVSWSRFYHTSRFVSDRTAHPKVCLLSPLLSLRSAIFKPSAANLHRCFASLFSPCSGSSFQRMFSMPKKTAYVPFDVLHGEPFINTSYLHPALAFVFFLNLIEPNSLPVHIPFLTPTLPAHYTSIVRQLPAISSSIPETPSRPLRSTPSNSSFFRLCF